MSEQIVSGVAITLFLVASGKATHYAPAKMDIAVRNRVHYGDIDTSLPHWGYVALADKEYLGMRVLIELPDGEFVGPFLVADCGAHHDLDRLKDSGFAVDFSYELAEKYFKRLYVPLYGVKVWLMWGGADANLPVPM